MKTYATIAAAEKTFNRFGGEIKESPLGGYVVLRTFPDRPNGRRAIVKYEVRAPGAIRTFGNANGKTFRKLVGEL